MSFDPSNPQQPYVPPRSESMGYPSAPAPARKQSGLGIASFLISIAGGVFNAITRGQDATCDAVQIFNKSNNQWRAKVLKSEEVDQEAFLEYQHNKSVSSAH